MNRNKLLGLCVVAGVWGEITIHSEGGQQLTVVCDQALQAHEG